MWPRVFPRIRGHRALRRRISTQGGERIEENEMKTKLTRVYVDDQEKALRFYTEVLGFVKKADFSQGPFR
jgi:glyoxalase/bleomycin resistance protein/dioxygenase superfamily protein